MVSKTRGFDHVTKQFLRHSNMKWSDRICLWKAVKKGTCSAVQFSHDYHDCWPQIVDFFNAGTLVRSLIRFITGDSYDRGYFTGDREFVDAVVQHANSLVENGSYRRDIIVQSAEAFARARVKAHIKCLGTHEFFVTSYTRMSLMPLWCHKW